MSTGTLLFSGTDLATLCDVEDLSEFWSASDLAGELPSFPGRSGALALQRPTSAKIANAQVTVAADTLAEVEDGVAAVKALLAVNVEQTVTRRKITGSGSLDVEQSAIVRRPEERWLAGAACTLIIAVELLDGLWYGDAVNIASAAGTQTVGGEAPTAKMTATLAAGAARTVTNTSNGYSFTFSTTVPTGGVVVDVGARTAKKVSDNTDMSAYLSWNKVQPFQLEAGSNTITVSAGTASIDYQPAYL